MRWTMALLTALLLLYTPRAMSATVVQTSHVAALVDEMGESIISDVEIERVYAVREDVLYAVGQRGEYRLYDAEGHVLSNNSYSMIADVNGTLICQKNGRFGALSDEGGILVEPVWTQLVPAAEGAFLALRGDVLDDVADEILLLDADGSVRATGIEVMNGLNPFSEDRMPYTTSDGRCGYLDEAGSVAIPAVWNYTGPFQNHTAIVSDAKGYGLIDSDGKVKLPTGYVWMARGDGFVAAGTERGDVEVYAPDGDELIYTLKNARQVSVVGRYIAAQVGDETSLYNESGICISLEAEDVLFLPGWGEQVIVSNGAWGGAGQRMIDFSGATLADPRQGLLPLCAGRYAFMKVSGVEYYSSDLGGLQTSWDYDSLRYGLMDDAGREILPARYREIRAAGEDRLLLIDDEGTTLADLDGQAIRRWKAEGGAAIGE